VLEKILAFALAGALYGGTAASQSVPAAPFPSQPIRMIVPFAAGGTTDILGRLLAQKLSEALGQPVVVLNKPGAAGNIGVTFALQQPVDGYTVVIGGGNHAVNATLYKHPPFNFVTDLAPLGLVGTIPNIMVVPEASPAKTPTEFVAYAKSRPGQLNFGSSGNGTTPHLTGEMFKAKTATQMTHIPYTGSAPALVALTSNQLDLMFDSLTSSIELVRAGRLRALAVTGATRSRALPDVPTLKESGIDVEAASFVGLYAPRNTPASIVQRYNTEIRNIVKQPTFTDRVKELGVDVQELDVLQFAAFTKNEVTKWADVIHYSGVTAD